MVSYDSPERPLNADLPRADRLSRRISKKIGHIVSTVVMNLIPAPEPSEIVPPVDRVLTFIDGESSQLAPLAEVLDELDARSDEELKNAALSHIKISKQE